MVDITALRVTLNPNSEHTKELLTWFHNLSSRFTEKLWLLKVLVTVLIITLFIMNSHLYSDPIRLFKLFNMKVIAAVVCLAVPKSPVRRSRAHHTFIMGVLPPQQDGPVPRIRIRWDRHPFTSHVRQPDPNSISHDCIRCHNTEFNLLVPPSLWYSRRHPMCS